MLSNIFPKNMNPKIITKIVATNTKYYLFEIHIVYVTRDILVYINVLSLFGKNENLFKRKVFSIRMEKDNNSIFLNDILGFTEEEIKNMKIRFNKEYKGIRPIDLFKTNKKELFRMQFNNGKRQNFKGVRMAIGFARIKEDKWLLFGISRITKDLNKLNEKGYEHQEIGKYKKYFGRLVVKYKIESQNLVRWAEGLIEKIEVDEIYSKIFDDDDFPGYENVDLTWRRT